MADTKLRDLERRAASGDAEAEIRLLQEQIRTGQRLDLKMLPGKMCASGYHIVNWGMGEPPCENCGDHLPCVVTHDGHEPKWADAPTRVMVELRAQCGSKVAQELVGWHHAYGPGGTPACSKCLSLKTEGRPCIECWIDGLLHIAKPLPDVTLRSECKRCEGSGEEAGWNNDRFECESPFCENGTRIRRVKATKYIAVRIGLAVAHVAQELWDGGEIAHICNQCGGADFQNCDNVCGTMREQVSGVLEILKQWCVCPCTEHAELCRDTDSGALPSFARQAVLGGAVWSDATSEDIVTDALEHAVDVMGLVETRNVAMWAGLEMFGD